MIVVEDGMVVIEEAEEEEGEMNVEVEVEMMIVVEDGMVVIETVAIGTEIPTTETEEGETAGAPQEELVVEIWPRDFKAWQGLMEMEGGEEEETKAQEWEQVDLMA